MKETMGQLQKWTRMPIFPGEQVHFIPNPQLEGHNIGDSIGEHPNGQVSPDPRPCPQLCTFQTYSTESICIDPWVLCADAAGDKKTLSSPNLLLSPCFSGASGDQNNTPQADFADKKIDPTPVGQPTQINRGGDLSPPPIITPGVQKGQLETYQNQEGPPSADLPLNNFGKGVMVADLQLTLQVSPGVTPPRLMLH